MYIVSVTFFHSATHKIVHKQLGQRCHDIIWSQWSGQTEKEAPGGEASVRLLNVQPDLGSVRMASLRDK